MTQLTEVVLAGLNPYNPETCRFQHYAHAED